MNAWYDCMKALADPDDVMTAISCEEDKTLTLNLEGAKEFSKNHNELYIAILEGAAKLNGMEMEQGRAPLLTVAYEY